MSLSKLPNLLKAQICSFLDFNEIKKFEQTNKSNQAFLKRYNLDKPKIYELSFYIDEHYYSDSCIKCSVKLDKDLSKDRIQLPTMREQDISTVKIMNLINEFRSINTLSFDGVCFNEETALGSVRTKIRRGHFRKVRFDLSKKSVMDFLKQLKHIEFRECNLDPSYINDELFSVFSENGTTLQFKNVNLVEVAVTDLTLDTLTKTHIPREIQIDLSTELTFGIIKKIIEFRLHLKH